MISQPFLLGRTGQSSAPPPATAPSHRLSRNRCEEPLDVTNTLQVPPPVGGVVPLLQPAVNWLLFCLAAF